MPVNWSPRSTGSNRPIAELLDPNPLSLEAVFNQQFRGMTLREVSVEELNQTRIRLVRSISQQLTDNQKAFLLSFKSGDPQWKLLKHNIASELPADSGSSTASER